MKLYKWKAYTADHQLADAGHAWGETPSDAERIAHMCVGGPLANRVDYYLVEPIPSPSSPYNQISEATVN